MIAITPTMRVMVAIKPVDFRRGIDGLAQLCHSTLASDPRDGTIFVFRCRNAKSIKLLTHDGQGFWLAQKRLASGRFRHWPTSTADSATAQLLADEFLTLLWAGNRKLAYAQAPLLWQRVESDPAAARTVGGTESIGSTVSTVVATTLPSTASTLSSASL